MSGSSEGSNIAKDDVDQPLRNEGEGYKKGDSEQEQMSKQDQNRQQLPGGNNSRQSSQNSHQPQLGNTQPGNPFSQGHTNKKILSRDHERVTAEPERRAQTQNSTENKEKATKIVLHERPNPENASSSCCSSPCCSIL